MVPVARPHIGTSVLAAKGEGDPTGRAGYRLAVENASEMTRSRFLLTTLPLSVVGTVLLVVSSRLGPILNIGALVAGLLLGALAIWRTFRWARAEGHASQGPG